MKKQKWFFSLPLVAGAFAAPLAVVACNDTKEKDEEINKLKVEKEQLANEKAAKEAELTQANSDKAALLAEKEQLANDKTAKEAELTKAIKEKEELAKLKEAELQKLNAKIAELEKINQYQKEENLKLQSEKELKLAKGVTEEKINAVEKVEGIEAIVEQIKETEGETIETKIQNFIKTNYSEKDKADELSMSILLESQQYRENEKVKEAKIDFSRLDTENLNDILKFAVDLVNAAK
ncbi:hypothetical protein [Mycoplasma sp. 31_09]|uniref:hypothetical protein n=1 Tax=Mycoplasma sp. 31_09 TaxID=3401663 RepID=UPI003AAA4C28